MFTVEMRINGTLIVHIYGHNERDVDGYKSEYQYHAYSPEDGEIISGKVIHDRGEGLPYLVSQIIADARERKRNAISQIGE